MNYNKCRTVSFLFDDFLKIYVCYGIFLEEIYPLLKEIGIEVKNINERFICEDYEKVDKIARIMESFGFPYNSESKKCEIEIGNKW